LLNRRISAERARHSYSPVAPLSGAVHFSARVW